MKFYDSLINDFFALCNELSKNYKPYNDSLCCENLQHQEIILKRDPAFELDGTGFNLVTSEDIESGVTIIGRDLSEIKKDCRFCRVTIIQTDDFDDEQNAHKLIRKAEYVKYHIFPEGYMMRISTEGFREKVRISKEALKKNLSFYTVGNLFIKESLGIPGIKAAKVFYICDECFEYNAVLKLGEKAEEITNALNHIVNNLNFDCNVCKLKSVCDEVEGMRELHFKSNMSATVE